MADVDNDNEELDTVNETIMKEEDANGIDKTQSELNGDSNGNNDSMDTAVELDEKDDNIATDDSKESIIIENEEIDTVHDLQPKAVRRSGRLSSKPSDAAASSKKAQNAVDSDDTQSTPKRRTTPRVNASASKLKTPEVGNVNRTPTRVLKRGATSEGRNAKPAKQQKRLSDPLKAENRGNEDPFSFDQNADQHPEPLKNIQMEKGAFGDVKYTTSPLISSASKYINTEKTASERRSFFPNLSDSRSSNENLKTETLSSLSEGVRRELVLSTGGSPAKKSTPRNKRDRTTSSKSSRASENTFDIDITQEEQKTTPKSQKRKSAVVDSALSSPKEIQIVAPTLTAEQQREVDHPQTNAGLLNGARVYALWSNDFYPAVVCGRDALSRYKVKYEEDNFQRDIPRTGVIPISHLIEGQKIGITNLEDNEYIPITGVIVRLPDVEDAEEWAKCEFEVRHDDSEKVEKVPWAKIYLDRIQAADLIKQIKNRAVLVNEENIVTEEGKRRSSARNRSLNTSAIETKTPVTTPASSQSAAPRSQSNKRTSKTSNKRTPKVIEEVEPQNLSFGKSPREKFATPKLKTSQKETTANDTDNESLNDKNSQESASEANTAKPTAIVSPSTKTIEPRVEIAPAKIFQNMKFVLTSANRQRVPDQPPFNKRECRILIEERGGIVIDDFAKDFKDGEKACLIADTYYRTQKYLSALSLSIPCVSHNFITECVRQNALLDYENYMLPAGESFNDQIYPWKPLKGILLADKKVCVYSNQTYDDKRIVGFVNIWTPIIKNLGATLISMPTTFEERTKFINEGNINILLTDPACENELVSLVENNGGWVVSSEWVIQSIIAGAPCEVNASERFRYDVA